MGIVGELGGVLFVVEWNDGEDWTEDLALDDLRILLRVRDERGRVVGAGLVQWFTAGGDGSAGFGCAGDEAVDLVAMRGGDERADVRRGFQGSPTVTWLIVFAMASTTSW